MGCDPYNTKATDACIAYQSGTADGVTVDFQEYPLNVIRSNGAYNIPTREGVAVMYPSVVVCGNPLPASSASCGKLTRAVPHNNFGQDCSFIYDYYPTGLSYDFGYSDTWFSYMYDTSDDQGIIGKPCYYYETESSSTTNNTSGAETSSSGDGNCFPCSGFTCTPASTTLSYTIPEGNFTGDQDCPHPTLFGFGSDRNKLAFSYDSLSTTLPNGVTDFSFSYDGVTYTDAWNQQEVTGILYTTTQNPPYQSGDEALDDFQVFELDDVGNNKTGLRVKVEIKSVYDDSGASTVFSGTSWLATEVLSPGTGYANGDTFTLQYQHTHPDNTVSTLTVNLRVTGVGPYEGVGDATGFDILRKGDTINGHEITRAFHTDIDNFPYHVIYLDGNGSDFTKETQYTSNRNHVITAKAGKGIKDRAILIGKYEFMDKSIQFITADLDKNAPDIWNVLVQPTITPTLTNGVLTGVTIDSGGSGWNQYGREPEIIVTDPMIDTGRTAVVEGTFSAGVLTGLTIKDGGAGYTDTNLPQIVVTNVHKRETAVYSNTIRGSELKDRAVDLINAFPKGDMVITPEQSKEFQDSVDGNVEERVQQNPAVSFKIKQDPNNQRIDQLPQRGYKKSVTDPLKDATAIKYDLGYLGDSTLPSEIKDRFTTEKDRSAANRLSDIAAITQDVVPEFDKRDQSFIETVQGTTNDLPHASTYTKYMMKQYRPDPQQSTTISVSLSCTPVNAGCSHFTCSAPAGSSGSTVDNGDGTTTTITYTMSGLLGDGCKAWTATGDMKMWNDLTAAASQFNLANKAYGNPYSE